MTTQGARHDDATALARVLIAATEHGEGRKEEILTTASRLFASTGLRTSLQDIADACGIRPGSLYHHFGSKEDIVYELLSRYHDALERLAAAALAALDGADAEEALELVTALCIAIAEAADRNSAAVQFTFYEPPAGSDPELVRQASRRPSAAVDALLRALRRAEAGGRIRPDLDVALLAERLCHTMLYVGTGLFDKHPTERVAVTLCDMLLAGVAAKAPSNSALDRSPAMRAVQQVIRTWAERGQAEDDRIAVIRDAARAEFGRRGYEVTTVREIAARAGMSTGAVYRLIGSKDELLGSIITGFAQRVMMGWSAALSAESSAVEKIDALIWLQTNVMDQFPDEFTMQLAWLRQSPPETSMFGWSFQSAVRSLRSLLSEGVRDGDLQRRNTSNDLTARCLLALTWMPEDSVRKVDKRAALLHARDTVLRGAVRR